jgi:hypothetical protein
MLRTTEESYKGEDDSVQSSRNNSTQQLESFQIGNGNGIGGIR